MRLLKKNLQIAIDGPVAAGKSIAARLLAKKLGIFYIYTGAMYRAVALLGLKNHLDLEKEKPLIKLLKKAEIKIAPAKTENRICEVLLDGKDITEKIFTPRVHWGSSQVAVFPEVRKILVKKQKEIAKNQPVIMEGRDITYRVLPNADLKVYMTADIKVRTKRRLVDLKKQGFKTTPKNMIKEIKKRDFQDAHRKADPLKIVANAWILDTSKMTIEEEVEAILERLREMKLIE